MNKIIKTLVLFLMLFIVISVGINVKAATGDVYNIVTCPGEDMATQMQINWQSPSSIIGLKLEYTEVTDTEFSKSVVVDAVSRSFSRQNGDPSNSATYTGFSTPRNIWNVALDNLKPGTKYMYRITNGSKVYSATYNFETGSLTDDEFSFLFMTDPQYYREIGASMYNTMTEAQIAKYDVKFTFITGDISDKGGNSSYWDMFYTKSSLKKIPMATTVGNHEYYDSGTVTTDNLIYNQFFYNPQNGPENVKGSSYYFTYNNALFIMLDSEAKGVLAEQQAWFRSVCESVDASYIIVGCHKSPYAAGPYVDVGQAFISNWGPLFDEFQVDFVLTGHDHVYTRTKPVYANQVTEEKYKGTVYIEGGSAGEKYYSVQSQENADKWAKTASNVTACTVITLGKEKAQTNTYDLNGTLIDSSSVDRKRVGTVDPNFSKDTFEKSFVVESNINKMENGTISWDSNGFGHVKSITFTNENNSMVIGATTILNIYSNSLQVNNGFVYGETNKIKVEVNYKDSTKSEFYLELDNTVDWGTIYSAEAVNITSVNFSILLKVKLNPDLFFVNRIRLIEDGRIKKTFNINEEDLTKEELLFEITNKFIQPETTHTYTVVALNKNGNIMWEQELVVTSLREISEEEQFKIDMANTAFQAMIDNLLKALGASEE